MSPCTNKIPFKIDITCIPFNFRGEKETLNSYKPEYCYKEGRGGGKETQSNNGAATQDQRNSSGDEHKHHKEEGQP